MATLRQKRAAKILVETGRKSVSDAMRKAGYSPKTATHPDKLTKSKAWPELLEEMLPDDLLTKKHLELLNKKEYIVIGKKGEREVISTGEIDPFAVSRGLEMGYKLKGRFTEKIQLSSSTEDMTDEELKQREKELEQEVLKRKSK